MAKETGVPKLKGQSNCPLTGIQGRSSTSTTERTTLIKYYNDHLT
jgi:hypothetical protein